MAHFYGTIHGSRGESSRLGTANSGLTTVAASWSGAIVTVLFVKDDIDCFEIRMERHQGKGDYKVIATGKVGDAMSIKPCEAHHA